MVFEAHLHYFWNVMPEREHGMPNAKIRQIHDRVMNYHITIHSKMKKNARGEIFRNA